MPRSREEIVDERRKLLRGNRFLKDDVHQAADQVIENTAAYVRDALSFHATTFLSGEIPTRRTEPGGALLDLAALWALTQPQFVKMIHEAIDANVSPTLDAEHLWSPFSRAELDAKVAALDEELEAIEREGKRAEILARKAEADAALAQLEQD
jgi:hypothetical protein